MLTMHERESTLLVTQAKNGQVEETLSISHAHEPSFYISFVEALFIVTQTADILVKKYDRYTPSHTNAFCRHQEPDIFNLYI